MIFISFSSFPSEMSRVGTQAGILLGFKGTQSDPWWLIQSFNHPSIVAAQLLIVASGLAVPKADQGKALSCSQVSTACSQNTIDGHVIRFCSNLSSQWLPHHFLFNSSIGRDGNDQIFGVYEIVNTPLSSAGKKISAAIFLKSPCSTALA